MLKRSFRLNKRDIDRIYKEGRSFSFDSFVVRFFPNRASHARFSVVISKKVLPLAVDRNHTKRQIFLVISDHKELWQDKNLDIALILKKFNSDSVTNTSIEKILMELK